MSWGSFSDLVLHQALTISMPTRYTIRFFKARQGRWVSLVTLCELNKILARDISGRSIYPYSIRQPYSLNSTFR